VLSVHLAKTAVIVFAAGIAEFSQAVENVVVTGTRRPANSTDLPYSVTVIDQQSIQQKLVRTLPDALAQTPGVFIQKSANGQGAPFLRGFTGYRTLTLIDGVRYNNSVYRDGPNEYFSLIDFNSVGSIEVFGGPTSTHYGSDAIGGALNIHTAKSDYAEEEADSPFIHGLQRLSFASTDNSQQSRTEIQFGKGGLWGAHLGYSIKDFGNVKTADLGKQHHTGYGEVAWDTRIDIELHRDWVFSMVYQQLEQDEVWRTFSTEFAQSFAGSSVGTDHRRLKDQQRDLGYLRLHAKDLLRHLNSAQLTLSRQTWNEDGDRIRGNGRRSLEFFKSTMLGADVQFSSQFDYIDFVYGFDIYRDSVDSGRRDFNANGSLNRIRIQGPVGDNSRYLQHGAYVQGIVEPHDRIRLELGSRYTEVSATIGRYEDPLTNLPARFSDTWDEFVHCARASFVLENDRQTTAWIGLSESFRAPNVADISRFGASRSTELEVAALSLDPEKFFTVEFGLRRVGWPLDFSAVVFHTRIRDYITSTPTGRIVTDLTEVSKQNSARGFVQGIELSGSRDWSNGLGAWSNFTWLETELETAALTGTQRTVAEPLSRSMPLTINFGFTWDTPDRSFRAALDVTIAAQADDLSRGDRADTQRIPPGGTPAYEFVRFSCNKRLNETFDLALGVSNIFDTTYRSHGSGVNEPGIGVDVRLSAQF
jgi:hemoglobin/transferrin/lactoferrin receptor protein